MIFLAKLVMRFLCDYCGYEYGIDCSNSVRARICSRTYGFTIYTSSLLGREHVPQRHKGMSCSSTNLRLHNSAKDRTRRIYTVNEPHSIIASHCRKP